MQISLDSAQRIVSEISSVLGTDVNLMDQSAVIIASTDADRVGSHHLGAEQIISQKLDRLIISPDDRMPGVRPGLNLPIWAEGTITGVLGITGDPTTFTTPAHVLQKMTEILLRETRIRENAERRGRSYTRFVQAWLSDSQELTAGLIAEGQSFNVDVRAQYIVAVARLVSTGSSPQRSASQSFQSEVDRLSEAVLQQAKAHGAHTALLAGRMVMLFPIEDPRRNMGSHNSPDPDAQLSDITGTLGGIAEKVRKSTPLRLAVGISAADIPAPEAAEQAKRALGYAVHSPADVHRFDQLTLELLLTAVGESDRLEFTRHVFAGIPANSRNEALRSLRAYFDTDGSLSRAADALHIHKNTLTGRLNKIAETTGLDPRRISDAAILWLGLQLTPQLPQWA